MILISTSKKADRYQKLLGKRLNNVIPNSKYVPRGRKDFWKLHLLCLRMGYKRIMLCHKDPKGSKLILVKTEDLRYLNPLVIVKKWKFFDYIDKELFSGLIFEGKKKETVKKLLDSEEQLDNSIICRANEKKIVFMHGNKKLLVMDIEYAERKGFY